ncbi:butyrophilin subfamily 3 member A2 isoform X2 [Haplochromis burtoni]|uniref:butyrophilin subfamily 3 member A2 isoform X2 n=1 Tax=Haplochromis burtoni TaxID=8153 RepID=UPI0003BD624E|nr:butyrophilin subfamily 3 member A2 isoform X2 [Haplochromis burtoni]
MKHLAALILIVTTSLTVPTLTKVIVEEGSAAVLPCALSSKQDITNVLFDWKKGHQEVFMYDAGVHYNNGRPGQDGQFKGRVSHLEEELKHGNASIRINNTRVSDSGNYTCLFPRLNPPRTFSVQLIVSASMTPYTAILNVTEDGVTLRCEVPGVFPKPKLEWEDSNGNVLPAEEPQVSEKRGRYYVSLRSTVSRTTTNLFVCVARQEDIHHQTKAEIYVPEKIFEECKVSDQISVHGWSVVLGILIGAVGTLLMIGAIGTCQRDRCGPYTTVLSPSTCSKCGETVDQSGPNSRDAPTPGPAVQTTHLSDTQRSTERGPTDSFQREPQTAEPVSLSQCGETSGKGGTNETNTNITQKSAGKLKHLTTQEKPGAERAKEIGSNGEIKLDVERDNRD